MFVKKPESWREIANWIHVNMHTNTLAEKNDMGERPKTRKRKYEKSAQEWKMKITLHDSCTA